MESKPSSERQLVAVESREGRKVLTDALAATRDRKYDGPLSSRAEAIETWLKAQGYTLAKLNH